MCSFPDLAGASYQTELCCAGCLCLGTDLLGKYDDGTEQKTYENAQSIVHDCVDVIEIYDRNVFNKHWLMQKLSHFYVLSLIYKAEVFLKRIENFISEKWRMSRNNEQKTE